MERHYGRSLHAGRRWLSAHYLFRGIIARVVAANRDQALTAQQVSIAVIAAPSTFRRWLAAQISRFNAAHAVGANLVFFPQRHFAGGLVPAGVAVNCQNLSVLTVIVCSARATATTASGRDSFWWSAASQDLPKCFGQEPSSSSSAVQQVCLIFPTGKSPKSLWPLGTRA